MPCLLSFFISLCLGGLWCPTGLWWRCPTWWCPRWISTAWGLWCTPRGPTPTTVVRKSEAWRSCRIRSTARTTRGWVWSAPTRSGIRSTTSHTGLRSTCRGTRGVLYSWSTCVSTAATAQGSSPSGVWADSRTGPILRPATARGIWRISAARGIWAAAGRVWWGPGSSPRGQS